MVQAMISWMEEQGMDAFIVPSDDPHLRCDYVVTPAIESFITSTSMVRVAPFVLLVILVSTAEDMREFVSVLAELSFGRYNGVTE